MPNVMQGLRPGKIFRPDGAVCVSACKFDPLSRGIGVQI
jgi:hypothetical protein